MTRLGDRLVELSLRCYPPAWRDRHGEEASELARLLIRDGVPAALVASSYLNAAARERVFCRRRRLAPALAALVAAVTLLGLPMVLLDSSTAANAASGGGVVISISNRSQAVRQLESAFRAHHFDIEVVPLATGPQRVGSVLAVRSRPGQAQGEIRQIAGPCADGGPGCIDALEVPVQFAGRAVVVVGVMEPVPFDAGTKGPRSHER
jgi:hypothetical protein